MLEVTPELEPPTTGPDEATLVEDVLDRAAGRESEPKTLFQND